MAAGEETDEEDKVCESGESERDPEIEEELMVERGAVSTGVGGEEPGGEKERGVGGARDAGGRHRLRIARSFW